LGLRQKCRFKEVSLKKEKKSRHLEGLGEVEHVNLGELLFEFLGGLEEHLGFLALLSRPNNKSRLQKKEERERERERMSENGFR